MKFDTLILFSYDFPPSSGGISRLCHKIAVGQTNYFEKVIVMTRKKSDADFTEEPFQVITLPQERIACEKEAVKILKNYHKEKSVILTGLWYPEALLALLSGHRNIYTLAHGAEIKSGKSLFRKFIWHAILAERVLRKVKGVISNSHFTKNLVLELSPKAKVKALPLGVDVNQFKPIQKSSTKQAFVISSLSRIHQFKGYDQVLEALCNLPITVQSNIRWTIGGTGPYLEAFKEKVKQTDKNFTVDFLGFIPDNELCEFYNNSDLFILFTQDIKHQQSVEGFGLVFLEAQACGVPVIGTKTGGIADAITDNKGGWLFEQDNLTDLTAKIAALYNNPLEVKEQSEIARKRMLACATWEIYNHQLAKLIT